MKESVDVSQLSAYAVYRNLIPGVKSYEDHQPKANKRRKPKKEADEGDSRKNGQVQVSNGASAAKASTLSVPKKTAVIKPNITQIDKAALLARKMEKSKMKRKAKKEKKKEKRRSSNGASTTDNSFNTSGDNTATTPKPAKQPAVAPKKTTKPPPAAQQAVQKKRVELQAVPSQGEGPKAKQPKNLPTRAPETVRASSQQNGSKSKSSINIKSLINSEVIDDSEKHGRSLFEWMISPTPSSKFFSDFWEKKPLLVKHGSKYFKWLLSSELLDETLRENKLYFGKNVDLTSYTDGVRETHNPEGRALPAVVWDFYSNGCSVRVLNPQTYIKNLWRLNASLQEMFGTFVGANVYLTPPDTQGFAPHYDDIEAFILQVEGKKHWKLYAPRSPNEELPRFSSGNFNEEKDKIGKPILDVVLEEGDMLYFPRGIIHQAKAVDGEHSLHITVSCYQTNTYGDLLKEYLPMALERAQINSVKFRKGLPTDYLSYMGLAHAESKDKAITKRRNEFHKMIGGLVQELLKVPCDFAADQVGKKFVFDSLPPFINAKEKDRSVYGGGEFMVNGRVFNSCEIDPDVEVKLIRKNCMRLMHEDNVVKLYFTLENSLEYHAEEPQVLEIPEESVEGVKYLISRYPEYTKIQDLPIEDEILKLQTASDLWEKGLLLTKEPLEPTDAEEMMVEEIDSEYEDSDDAEEEEDLDQDDEDEELELGDAIDDDSLVSSSGSEPEDDDDDFEEPPPKKMLKQKKK